ncbi:MAG TPA: hypothetical protein VJI12_00935 [archaeon]|nr:hypothetical protein [archaeon]
MNIERIQARRGDRIETFEVGYNQPDDCDFLYFDGRLEEIWGHEVGSREGTHYESVETRSGVYDVDGTTIFGKMIEKAV